MKVLAIGIYKVPGFITTQLTITHGVLVASVPLKIYFLGLLLLPVVLVWVPPKPELRTRSWVQGIYFGGYSRKHKWERTESEREKGETPYWWMSFSHGDSEEPSECLIIVPPNYGKVGYSSTNSISSWVRGAKLSQLQEIFLMWGLSEFLCYWRKSSVRGAEPHKCLGGKLLACWGNVDWRYRGSQGYMGQDSKSVCYTYSSKLMWENQEESLLNMVDWMCAFTTPPSWQLSKMT